jgi:osmotically-inducible protein OsmY
MVLGSVLIGCAIVVAAAVPRHKSSNAAISSRGSELESGPTADQQLMTSSDRAITQAIRKSIHRDKTLSNHARNVSIIMHNGKVTLQGLVISQDEKLNLEAKAAAAAGTKNVTSRLKISPLH